MSLPVEISKMRCSECAEILSLTDAFSHEHGGQTLPLMSYERLDTCWFCHEFLEPELISDLFCEKCNLEAGGTDQMDHSPIAQRLFRRIHSAWLTNQGVKNVTTFITNYIEGFEPSDRGLLSWLAYVNLRENYSLETMSVSAWHTPSLEELDGDRKLALLPRNGADINQIEVLRNWYQNLKTLLLDQEPTGGRLNELENQTRNQKRVRLLEAIWGIGSDHHAELDLISLEFGESAESIRGEIHRSEMFARLGVRDEMRHLNSQRDQELFLARIKDRLKLQEILTAEEIRPILDELEPEQKTVVLEYVFGEYSEGEICLREQLVPEDVLKAIEVFSTSICP